MSKMRHYTKIAFIETGIEPDLTFEEKSRDIAKERGWEFEKLVGNLGLLRRLLNGDWNDNDFQVLQPGESFEFSYDEKIVRAI